jgi:TatD DNase family protein
LGFKISFAGPLTFSNAKQPPTVAQAIGIENILIETDSPYLSPQPLRGKRNEPMNVGYVAKRLAELKAMDLEELCRLISQTSSALLHW